MNKKKDFPGGVFYGLSEIGPASVLMQLAFKYMCCKME